MQQYKQNKKKSYADTVKTPPKAQKGRPNNNPPKPPPTQKPTRPSQSFQPRFKNNPTIDPAVKKQLDQIKSDMDLIKKNSEQTDALVSKFNNYIERAVKRRQRKEKVQKEKEINLDQLSKDKGNTNKRTRSSSSAEPTEAETSDGGYLSEEDVNDLILTRNAITENQEKQKTLMERLYTMMGTFASYNNTDSALTVEGDDIEAQANGEEEF